jgi:GNAT superfamily N-acetyltransferase
MIDDNEHPTHPKQQHCSIPSLFHNKMTSLTVESVHQTIDDVLQQISDYSSASTSHNSKIVSWCRVLSPSDESVPYAFGIEASTPVANSADKTEKVIASWSCYLGYSTWDGRMLYVDRVSCDDENDNNDQMSKNQMQTDHVYQILAKLAIDLGCARLSWKETIKPQWNPSHPPEFLEEWLFLEMDPPSMTEFLVSAGVDPHSRESAQCKVGNNPLTRSLVEHVVGKCIEQKSGAGKSKSVTYRLARPEDMDTVRHLVQQLAIYEKEPDAVNVTSEDYLLDGGSAEPLFCCILVDVNEDDNKTTTTVGLGFFFFACAVGKGRFLYLDDLFVEEKHRGKGAGKGIMELLAHIALSMECRKFVWTALDWNTPALQFYEKIGAIRKVDEKITRYCRDDLKLFAYQRLKKKCDQTGSECDLTTE